MSQHKLTLTSEQASMIIQACDLARTTLLESAELAGLERKLLAEHMIDHASELYELADYINDKTKGRG